MSDLTILGLAANATPTTSDLLGVWSIGAGTFNKSTIAQIATAMGISGAGSVVTGGFVLTVPATGTAALLQAANVFTSTQSISPSSIAYGGLAINMPASTGASAFGINYNGGARVVVTEQAGVNSIIMADADMGANVVGAGLYLGRNTYSGSPGAGFVRYTNRGGTALYTWIDSAGKFRIGPTAPTFDNDTTGDGALTTANLAAANVWTTVQNHNPTSTGVNALAINMPASTTAYAMAVNYNSIGRFFIVQQAAASQFIISDADMGSSALGAGLYIGRNSNATTPASAFIRLTAKNGVDYYLWIGSDGKVRVSTSAPTNALDVTGTVIGTQT